MGKSQRVAVAVALVVLALGACSSGEGAKTYGYPVSDLRAEAVRFAAANGERYPQSIKVVRTRFLRANDLISGDKVNPDVEPDSQVWVVQVVGDFQCGRCSHPRPVQHPTDESIATQVPAQVAPVTDRVAVRIMNVNGGRGRVFSLGRKTFSLDKLGHVVDLSKPVDRPTSN